MSANGGWMVLIFCYRYRMISMSLVFTKYMITFRESILNIIDEFGYK
jgi:hypothetical protein